MCTVAISNSPVFSPSSRVSSSIFCKSSPESLTLTHSPSASSSSPKSSFKFRLQKPLPPASGLIRASNEDGPTSSSTSPTFLKRKRPTRLAIPVAPLSFSADQSTPCVATAEDRWKEVEVEGDGYSVYCKRGKREAMEDRFKALVDFSGENTQVNML